MSFDASIDPGIFIRPKCGPEIDPGMIIRPKYGPEIDRGILILPPRDRWDCDPHHHFPFPRPRPHPKPPRPIDWDKIFDSPLPRPLRPDLGDFPPPKYWLA